MEPDTVTVDARGLKCPLPVLRTRKHLLALRPGHKLEVLCTDPVSVIDIPNLVREMGFHLQESCVRDGDYRFVIGQEADKQGQRP